MKEFTNYTAGPRGINTEAGTVWLEPGQSVEIDAKTIKGAIPDLGKAPAAADTSEIDGLKDQVADLTKQVEALTAEKADLTKQVEALTKPADAKK